MAVDVQQSVDKKIVYLRPQTLKPHPESLSIPMTAEDEKALRDDILQKGILHPIDVSSHMDILDGVHRWKYAQELCLETIPAIVFTYQEPEEETLHAIKANLKRRHINEGQKAMLALKTLEVEKELARKRKSEVSEKVMARQERDAQGKVLSVLPPLGGNTDASSKQVQEKPISRRSFKKEDEGESADITAKKTGVSARSIYRAQAVSKASPELSSAVVKGNVSLTKAYQQVKATENARKVEEAISSGRVLTDLEIMDTLGIPIQPYDVWNFPLCDYRFGHEYPGRIPGQLVAHCLYFWTKQGDVVLDPMAGSGTTIDVCNAMNRQVLAYDAHPCREDIALRDLATQGWPECTSQASLIFWDPPYFKKKDDAYKGQSISRLDREKYLAFFDQAIGAIPSSFHGYLAFLMSDYTDEESPENAVWFTDYVPLFLQHKWRIVRYIQTPLTTQNVHPDIVKKFRESRRMARLGRVLMVVQR